MISGYYYRDTVQKGKSNQQILKTIRLTVVSMTTYFLVGLLSAAIKHELTTYLSNCITVRSLIKIVLFNAPPFGGHLWYLLALIYVLVLAKCFYGKTNRKVTIIVIASLLIGDLLLGKYSMLLFHGEFSYIFVRNFVFVGLPYFLLGDLIRDNETRARSIVMNKKSFAWILVLLSIVSIVLEYYILLTSGMSTTRNHYASTTFLAVSLFYLAKRETRLASSKFLDTVSSVGMYYTAMIYVVHPMIIAAFSLCNSVWIADTALSTMLSVSRPIFVFVLSLAFSALHKRLVSRVSIVKKV